MRMLFLRRHQRSDWGRGATADATVAGAATSRSRVWRMRAGAASSESTILSSTMSTLRAGRAAAYCVIHEGRLRSMS